MKRYKVTYTADGRTSVCCVNADTFSSAIDKVESSRPGAIVLEIETVKGGRR